MNGLEISYNFPLFFCTATCFYIVLLYCNIVGDPGKMQHDTEFSYNSFVWHLYCVAFTVKKYFTKGYQLNLVISLTVGFLSTY